jgi:hypothetical protein
MAANMNYSSLFSDVQNYIERGGSQVTDPTVYNQIPRLINLAERNCMNTLKLQGVTEPLVDPTGLTQGVAVVTKPDRWRSTISMNYGSGTDQNGRVFLFPRSYEYCRSYWPDDSVTNSIYPPRFYADYDLLHWLIVPTPYATFPLEALCYMQPVYLDQNNQTNFFTNYTPNMLLYATLLEAAPFLKGDERVQFWQQEFDRQAQLLADTDLQKILDRAEQRRRA